MLCLTIVCDFIYTKLHLIHEGGMVLNNYELREKLNKLVFSKSHDERSEIIKNPIFMTEDVLDELRDSVNSSDSEYSRNLFQDYLELLIRYQEKGNAELIKFYSHIEIQLGFVDFVAGFDTYEKRKDFLISKPFLMDEKSLIFINKFIDNYPIKNKKIINKFRFYRNLIKACKMIGINEAFEDFRPPEQKYIDCVNSQMRAENLYHVFSSIGLFYDEISSDKIRSVFHQLQANYEEDENMRNSIVALWESFSAFQKNKNEIWFWEN